MDCGKKKKSVGDSLRGAAFYAAFAFAVFSTLFLGYLCFNIFIPNDSVSAFLGSGERLVKSLPSKKRGDTYSFLVLGDSKNNFGIMTSLLGSVEKRVDFAMFLGDATNANAASHAYFRKKMNEMDLKFPVFYVSGNNDFSPRAKKGYQGAFTKSDFERVYGPLRFAFSYGGDLFVGICSVGNSEIDEENFSFLKSLEKRRRKYKRCFVFEHIPPEGVPGYDPGEFQADPEYAAAFERLGADYVFASHFHGYQDVRFHGVDYVVTGGAGASFDDPDGTGQFFHAVEVTVVSDAVRRRFVMCPPRCGAIAWFESPMVRNVIPFLRRHTIVFGALIGVCLAVWVGLTHALWRRSRQGRLAG